VGGGPDAPPVRKKASQGTREALAGIPAKKTKTAARVAVITIPGDCGDLSPNKRLHWAQRRTLVYRWRAAAAHEAGKIRWRKGAERRVRISWLVRRYLPLDAANVHGSGCLKAIEDGIVEAGLVPDDSPRWVDWGLVTQENGRIWRGKAQVICTIEELPG
jgi:hypothetical protein